MFVIEDEWHAEWIGEFVDLADAYEQLRRLASLPWNKLPNRCPCTSWLTCERRYRLIEFDTTAEPWRTVSNEAILEVSAKDTLWLRDLPSADAAPKEPSV